MFLVRCSWADALADGVDRARADHGYSVWVVDDGRSVHLYTGSNTVAYHQNDVRDSNDDDGMLPGLPLPRSVPPYCCFVAGATRSRAVAGRRHGRGGHVRDSVLHCQSDEDVLPAHLPHDVFQTRIECEVGKRFPFWFVCNGVSRLYEKRRTILRTNVRAQGDVCHRSGRTPGIVAADSVYRRSPGDHDLPIPDQFVQNHEDCSLYSSSTVGVKACRVGDVAVCTHSLPAGGVRDRDGGEFLLLHVCYYTEYLRGQEPV
mmetsp:Transcript_44634/g.50038  ORF Transcript_44634/g.50038 Transcript_44634/m.50038 type:complete len:259 (+) Transcript_44634:97-873(+)